MTSDLPLTGTAEVFLALLFEPGEVFEVSGLPSYGADGGTPPCRGYFRDPAEAAAAVTELDDTGTMQAIEVTVNPCRADLLGRASGRFVDGAGPAATDADIVGRRWLPVAVETRHAAGVSATAAELRLAHDVALRIRTDLARAGWGDPIVAMSGNGYRLLYRIDLPTDDEGLVARCLAALADRYDDDYAAIDRDAGAAACRVKVIGTWLRLGENLVGVEGVEDRPHRRSELSEGDPATEPVAIDLLRALAGGGLDDETDAAADEVLFDLEFGVLRALTQYRLDDDEQGRALSDITELIAGVPFERTGNLRAILDPCLEHEAVDIHLLRQSAADLGHEPAHELKLLFRPAPRPGQAVEYARRLRESAGRRHAERVRREVIRRLERIDDPHEAVERATDTLLDAVAKISTREPVLALDEALDDVLYRLGRSHGEEFVGLPTRTLHTLDRFTLGIRGLTLLAGEPGVGKTSLGVQLGLDIVTSNPDACFVMFSFEMSADEMHRRLLACASGIPWRDIMLGNAASPAPGADGLRLIEPQRRAFDSALRQLRLIGPRITIIDCSGLSDVSFAWMRAVVASVKRKGRADRAYVLCDSLQSMPVHRAGGEFPSEVERDNHAIAQLLAFQHAAERDPVVVIGEQNRAQLDQAYERATLGTVRSIYAPDCVMFLVADDRWHEQSEDDSQPVDIAIRKIRDGGTRGVVKMRFLHSRNRFVGDSQRFHSVEQIRKARLDR
ncbi:MAG: DnaB-like helicase C-terminal domain-containing protein [Planctomycetota bacterium]|jgi:replicative DNA helicase